MIRRLTLLLAAATFAFGVGTANAQVFKTVDPGAINLGFMNVSNLPAPDGDGGYQFGGVWGFADLVACYDGVDCFNGTNLTLGPNTISDPNVYWYQCQDPLLPGQDLGDPIDPADDICGVPGAAGNKMMEANAYGEVIDGSLGGKTIHFSGIVLSNTLTSEHTAIAFIRDFAPDFSSVNQATVQLPASGLFNISLTTFTQPGRPVQWGFQIKGVNVWASDVGPYGSVTVGPDPATPTDATTWGRLKTMYR